MVDNGCAIVCLTVICGIGLLLTVILVPISFKYLNYDEFAYKVSSIGNVVDVSQVYGPGGRHFIGPTNYFNTFPANFVFVDMGAVKITTIEGGSANSTDDSSGGAGRTVTVYPKFQYKLDPKYFAKVYNQHNLKYAERIKLNAETILKENLGNFAVVDFFRSREAVRKFFNDQLNTRLNQKMFDGTNAAVDPVISVPAGKFQLRSVALDAKLTDRYLQNAIKNQDVERSVYDKNVTVERAKTLTDFVAKINAEVASITQNANGRATSIIATAEAEAARIRLEAVALGYKRIFDLLGIKDGAQKMKLVKMMALKNSSCVLVDDINPKNTAASRARKIYLNT